LFAYLTVFADYLQFYSHFVESHLFFIVYVEHMDLMYIVMNIEFY